ncbi:hypothetical protein YC2023_101279 [Brassica napus]
MQKMSRLTQASRKVGTKEGLWTWNKHVEFCEVWSKPIRHVQCWAGLHKLRADNIWAESLKPIRSSADTKKERSRQGSQAEPLEGGSFHGVSWRDIGLYTHDIESNDFVNHIRDVFRYFIVDVVDSGSTPDVARCGRELDEQFLSHEQG